MPGTPDFASWLRKSRFCGNTNADKIDEGSKSSAADFQRVEAITSGPKFGP